MKLPGLFLLFGAAFGELSKLDLYCGHDVDSGDCIGAELRYFFDVSSGECEPFLYSGCGGNSNNYRSMELCEKTCMSPEPTPRTSSHPHDVEGLPPACLREPSPGPCQGSFHRWFYSAQEKRCRPFVYGGCGSNGNNFESYVNCMDHCASSGDDKAVAQKSTEVCHRAPRRGPCLGSLNRWFYDPKTNSCKQFVYGGCQSNGNNFETFPICRDHCVV